MEGIIKLIEKLKISEELLKYCKVQLLTGEDIAKVALNKSDFNLQVKINIEYDLAYENLYIGVWNQVPEEYRRMFLVLSFLKAFCILQDNQVHDLKQQLKVLYVVDLGIIIGTGLEEASLLTELAQLLHELIGKVCRFFEK